MKHLTLLFCLIILGAGCTNADRPAAATGTTDTPVNSDLLTILPGERVGLITAQSTSADISRTYGEGNVQPAEIYIAEGESQQGLTLFPDSPKEIEVVLKPDGHPQFIRISRDDSPWKTETGVTVGTTLNELEQINGKAFSFYGFEWDFGGLVTDWKQGRLNSNLVIALLPRRYDALTDQMMGEVQLSSDDPAMEALDIRVGSMVVTF